VRVVTPYRIQNIEQGVVQAKVLYFDSSRTGNRGHCRKSIGHLLLHDLLSEAMVEIVGSYIIRMTPIGMLALQHIDGVTTMSARKERRHKAVVLTSEPWMLAPSPPLLSSDATQRARVAHEDLVISLEAVLTTWPAVARRCLGHCQHLPRNFHLAYASDVAACLNGSAMGTKDLEPLVAHMLVHCQRHL